MAGFGAFLGGLSGGSIGASVVSLILDTKRFDAGLVSAKGRLQTSNVQMESSTSKFAGVAQGAYIAAATAAVAFAAKAVGAAIEAEEAQLKLANSIENSSKVSKAAIPAFNAQAEAIRELTGADDEAITSAQAFLVQIGLTQQQVQRLTPLIVDLSVKMGTDLQTAAKAVGKAVNGNIGGLARMGIQVDKTKAATDSYAATLDALAGAEGFAAQRAEEQPWVKLQSTVEELQETIGGALLPVLQDWAEQMSDVAGGVGQATDALSTLGGGLPGWTANFTSFLQPARDLPSVLNPALGFLLHFVDAGEDTAEVSGEMLTAFKELGPGAIKAGQDLLEGFIPYMFSAGETTEETQRKVVRFANLTAREINEWKRDTRKDLREASLSIGGVGDRWQHTATQTINAARRMARDAQTIADDLDALADIRAPEAFKKWLVDQGPGWVHGYVDATRRGKESIEGYWRDASDSVRDQRRALNDVTDRLEIFRGTINRLPRQKRIDIDVHVNLDADPRIPPHVLEEALSDGLVREQTP